MSALLALSSSTIIGWLIAIPVVVLAAHVVPWVLDLRGIRAYPGPLLAKFSDVWLGWVAAQGHRSEVVHDLHEKYGTFVRIAPKHISISAPDALQQVYAHGNSTTKSNFYDAFVSIRPGLFSTRSRQEHARKRKIVAHIFSQKSVLEFEPYTRIHVGQLMKQWDRLYDLGMKGLSGDEGDGWQGRDGRVWFDCLPWYNYLAFDIIGDLAFGAPFGMLHTCQDAAPIAVSQKDAMASYGASGQPELTYLPAVQVLNDRGEYSASIGVLPPRWRPILVRFLPWYGKGNVATQHLAGIAIAAVAKRLATPSDRSDLLGKLQEGKDDEGNPMGPEELTAEALTQLIAGSDTTSNSSCAITYHLAKNQDVQVKLQRELDEALGSDDDPVATFEQVKRLPYLEAVVNEALRVHSTSGIGLPRLVPEGGITVCGRYFAEGTVLSVPSYTVHRDREVWGDDADTFRPERWFERDEKAVQKTFNPFSFGPRSCVGRNLAGMELLIFISSLLRRYHFVLENPGGKLETSEGFLRKPLKCRVGLKRRDL